MIGPLRRLIAGEVPLARAFWDYGIIGGTVLNALTTIAAMALLASGGPDAAVLALFALPIPYNLLVVVAVWRSASAYGGPSVWPNLARIAIVLWALVASAL